MIIHMLDEETLTTLDELARLLHAHRTSVRRWLRDAGVQAVILGGGRNGAVRYRCGDVRRWLADRPADKEPQSDEP